MSAGYGSDVWCAGGLFTARFTRGTTTVAHALFRRLDTPRGTLTGLLNDAGDDFIGDEEAVYGFDVAEYVGAVGPDAAAFALPALVRGELVKDDRVADVEVNASVVTNDDGTIDIIIECDVTLAGSGESFDLTVGVSNGEARLLLLGDV